MRSPTDQLLFQLKTHGPADAGELARRLGVSREAARQQLERLAARGLVRDEAERGGVGRPRRSWSLTDAGHSRFPDTHGQMTVELIDAVRQELGEAALTQIIARRGRAVEAGYLQALEGADDLETRLTRLAERRAAEGYMARVERAEDGAFLLIEDHCPICAAAKACQGFCSSELALFRALLAPARVERTQHLLDGARRCAYSVRP
jgi:predicted ArsR family transcriptional regulator